VIAVTSTLDNLSVMSSIGSRICPTANDTPTPAGSNCRVESFTTDTDALMALHVAYANPALVMASLKYVSVFVSTTGTFETGEKNRAVPAILILALLRIAMVEICVSSGGS